MIFKIQLIQPPHFPITANSSRGDGGGKQQGDGEEDTYVVDKLWGLKKF